VPAVAVNVSVMAGACVVAITAVATWVSVTAGAVVSAAPPPPQADKMNISSAVTMKRLLVIRSLLCSHVGRKLLIYLLPVNCILEHHQL
jgi:hypothetical protein